MIRRIPSKGKKNGRLLDSFCLEPDFSHINSVCVIKEQQIDHQHHFCQPKVMRSIKHDRCAQQVFIGIFLHVSVFTKFPIFIIFFCAKRFCFQSKNPIYHGIDPGGLVQFRLEGT